MLDEIARLDPVKIRTLFDTGGEYRRSRSGGDFAVDFHAGLRKARESGPVHAGTVEQALGLPHPAPVVGRAKPPAIFSVFDYDTVNAVFRDPETFSSEVMQSTFDTFGRNILGMGGTEHSRHRGVVQPSFNRNMMQWWADRWINDLTGSLLDRIEARGSAELNVEFCALLPLLTITGSFGVGMDDTLRLRELIEQMIGATVERDDRIAAAAEAGEILGPVIADRRAEPRDDLISKLLQGTIRDEDGTRRGLTDAEILAFARLILTAGSGTTWRQLGITLWALLNEPDQLDAVRRDRSLVRNAIEESLRWEVTDPTFYRTATRDTELGGVAVPAGSRVALCLTAANHDPKRWDDPERFDVRRPLRPHLSFAGGPHVCLGMHLARAEMSVALNAILDRLPNLRWAPGAERPVLMGLHWRGPSELPVVFG
ncbi:cytochrome P450 [Actinomadura algeriensis]|uniref:Cytochrome P450 n=1 Tax=Actinomadura algeriensis TaxID=1679523 RepID=A0ABR9JI15_9ACTN|nr:cytochrome P450 [Actinomadura algeriensis]MBE1530211.1 cytochrome P450 [Actinomadura algeriensis]